AEAEIEAPLAHRDREIERLGIASLGRLLDRGAARIAQAEQPRSLVEGLASRVVHGLAEDIERRLLSFASAAALGSPVVPHASEQGVAAARNQTDEGRLERIGLQEVGGDVTVQMVHRNQRLAVRAG